MNNIQSEHNPGGKIRLKIPEGVKGSGKFHGPNNVYRSLLTRSWGNTQPFDGSSAVLWIGMNPSTADWEVDDPTIRRECDFTDGWGYKNYIKCNVMDWRATKPSDIPVGRENSQFNMIEIKSAMIVADKIVMCFGKIDMKYLASSVIETVTEITNHADYLDGLKIYCLGTNQDGSPKHPLYLKKTTELELWNYHKWIKNINDLIIKKERKNER